jgi:hypothetical protein
MIQVIKNLSSFNGVGWNSKMSVSIPAGPTYNEIHLKTNLTAAQLRQVSVVLAGDTIIQVSGEDLVMMERYKGHYVDDSIFVIPFGHPTAKNKQGALFGSLVTLAGEQISLEVETGAGDGSIELEAISFQSPSVPVRMWKPRIRTHVMQANAIGWNDYTTWPAASNTSIKRAYFKSEGMKQLKIEIDNLIYHDVKSDIQANQQKRVGRFPQNNVYIFDPTMYGFEQGDIFNTGHTQEFVFRVDTAKSEPIPILFETIEQLVPNTPPKP